MGFVGELLGGINGIQWFYIVGMIIFIVLFIVIVYRTFRIPKKEIDEMKNSIFNEEDLASKK